MGTSEVLQLRRVRQAAADGTARRQRLAARLSQEEIGAACGVSAATVSRWETGERRPRGEAGLRYARLLVKLEEAGRAAV